MIHGLLLYNREEYLKNSWFAQKIQSEGLRLGMHIDLLFADQIHFLIAKNALSLFCNKYDFSNISFIINRTRDSTIALHFEMLGYTVFNNSKITDVCNNKAKTHQYVNTLNIPSATTLLCNKKRFSYDCPLPFPLVLKSISGHGGKHVSLVENRYELERAITILPEDEFILQEFSKNCGIDIRIYVIGKSIVAAVKRSSAHDFRANISINGKSEIYILQPEEERIVKKIIRNFDFDFVGIDFILDEHSNILFNEIEDVVGCRSVYCNYSFDIVELFMQYIQNKIQ